MPDPIARKRLKKKMLDRWENEGGRIAVAPTGADDPGPTSENEGKGKQPLTARDNSKIAGRDLSQRGASQLGNKPPSFCAYQGRLHKAIIRIASAVPSMVGSFVE